MSALVPISVYIITLNEAVNLSHLLPQLVRFAEVIIVDSGSTDQTAAVAARFTNVKFSIHPWQGFAAQKAHALSLCENSWVLNLDADEALTDGFIAEMLSCVEANKVDALQCKRRLLRWGRRPQTFQPDDVLIRLFRKSAGHYADIKVHERILIKGKVKESNVCLLHHENLTYTQRIAKTNQYSQLKAEDKLAKGSRCSVAHLVLAFPIAFVQCYFFKGCFLDGIHGLLSSMNHAIYSYLKYAKLWELQNLADYAEEKAMQENAQEHSIPEASARP